MDSDLQAELEALRQQLRDMSVQQENFLFVANATLQIVGRIAVMLAQKKMLSAEEAAELGALLASVVPPEIKAKVDASKSPDLHIVRTPEE